MALMRSEFDLQTTDRVDGGREHSIVPAISGFSDNIVISYPLSSLFSNGRLDERFGSLVVLGQFQKLVSIIAAAALRIALLVRGGATIGKLFHAQGVVFGDALVDAYRVESKVAKYPRVVLSHSITITKRANWIENPCVVRNQDGMYCID
jgi:hypothetical protein